ncbi:MAG: hypothetical protein WA632_06220 [Gallionella sp.]
MKFSTADFALLRWNIAALCAAAIFCSVIFYSSNIYVESAKGEMLRARDQSNDARRHLSAAVDDRENMSIYADEYGALTQLNIIGEDKRLDWMEDMENLRRLNLVIDFNYQISPQKKYTPKPPISSGNFEVYYSEMKLHFSLLHEVQLVDFFNAMTNDIRGWYQLDGCSIQRKTGTPTDSKQVRPPQLTAECSGGWVTLKSRNVKS